MKIKLIALIPVFSISAVAVAAQQIPRLVASGPDPQNSEKLMLFGQFVGDWKFEMTVARPDGTKMRGDGEWHFGWILGGRAVQDVWIARDDLSKPSANPDEYGTTVRFYDPKLDSWHVVWCGPTRGTLMTFVAKKTGEAIVMDVDSVQGLPPVDLTSANLRRGQWIFDQITPNSFRWHAAVSMDGGKTWQVTQEMFAHRSAVMAQPH